MLNHHLLGEEINHKKEDLHGWAVGKFNTMVLLVRPYLTFMNVISILPPLGHEDLFIQPEGPASPPIFTKEGALHLLETKWKGWEAEILIFSIDHNVFTTLFEGELINVQVEKIEESFQRAQTTRRRSRGGDRPGYHNLPTPVGATSNAKRISAEEKARRNQDIKEFYEAGVPIAEIAKLVGLSYGYTYQLAIRDAEELSSTARR